MSGGYEDLNGQRIAQYQIVDKIGQGGMGVVYKAQDTALDRVVAMKFLPPWMQADEEAEKRFVHEAKASSALDDANIATIYEIGRSDKGQMFIVMGFYEGPTLEEVIADEGPIDVDRAVEIVRQLASGLARAHEDGITHRDIKPGNLMFNSRKVLKILDFGLAKMQDITMTMGGVSLGTVAYMSPEQARNEPVDARTDLWAVGVVLYEMLAGRRPFAAGYEAAILYAAANEQHEGVDVLRDDVPEWLGKIVDRLLEKDPDKRFQTADDLVAALDSQGAAKGAGAPASTGAESGVVAAAGASGVESGTVEGIPGGPATGQLLSGQIAASDIAQELLNSGMFKPAAPPGQKRMIVIAFGLLAAVAVTAWFLSRGPSAEELRAAAREHHTSALDYRNNSQFTLAQGELEQALALDSTYAEAWSTLSAININLSDYDAALRSAQSAVRHGGAEPSALYNMAYALEELGRYQEAIATYSLAVNSKPDFVRAYSAWGNRLIEIGAPSTGLEILTKGLEADPNSPYRFLLLKNQGKAHLALNAPLEAVEVLEASVGLNDEYPEALRLLATAYDAAGMRSQGTEYWERYLEKETDPGLRRAARERLGLQ